MTNKFTVTLTHDRDEILADARKFVEADNTLPRCREYLNAMYPAWSINQRTSIMVELLFRGEDDLYHEIFTRKLAELNEKEGLKND